MDVVRALVGLHAFEVAHVPETLVLIEDADTAQDVARGARGVERDLDVVHLGHGNVVVPRCAGVFQLRQAVGQQLRLGNLGKHARQLCLHQLETADRTVELHPAHRILPRLVVTRHRRPDRAPGDSVTRLVET